jgi:cation diffusion facilitator family transporter
VRPLENNLERHDDVQQVRQARQITWIGLAINLALFVAKFVLGFLGSSQAVIADAFHSLSDVTTDIAILLGITYWSAPPDECHPYGHKRIETIVTVVIGMALCIIALGIGYNALALLKKAHVKPPGKIAAFGAILSIVTKEAVYHWTMAVATRIKSPALMANAWHHRSDGISSIPVLITVTVAIFYPNLAFVDLVGALVVSLFILKVSWDILRPAIQELADSGASLHDRDKIKSIVMEVNGVKGAHAIRTRKFGTGIYVDLHVLVDGTMTVKKGHTVSHKVKNKLLVEGPDILDVVVHIEPYSE